MLIQIICIFIGGIIILDEDIITDAVSTGHGVMINLKVLDTSPIYDTLNSFPAFIITSYEDMQPLEEYADYDDDTCVKVSVTGLSDIIYLKLSYVGQVVNDFDSSISVGYPNVKWDYNPLVMKMTFVAGYASTPLPFKPSVYKGFC